MSLSTPRVAFFSEFTGDPSAFSSTHSSSQSSQFLIGMDDSLDRQINTSNVSRKGRDLKSWSRTTSPSTSQTLGRIGPFRRLWRSMSLSSLHLEEGADKEIQQQNDDPFASNTSLMRSITFSTIALDDECGLDDEDDLLMAMIPDCKPESTNHPEAYEPDMLQKAESSTTESRWASLMLSLDSWPPGESQRPLDADQISLPNRPCWNDQEVHSVPDGTLSAVEDSAGADATSTTFSVVPTTLVDQGEDMFWIQAYAVARQYGLGPNCHQHRHDHYETCLSWIDEVLQHHAAPSPPVLSCPPSTAAAASFHAYDQLRLMRAEFMGLLSDYRSSLEAYRSILQDYQDCFQQLLVIVDSAPERTRWQDESDALKVSIRQNPAKSGDNCTAAAFWTDRIANVCFACGRLAVYLKDYRAALLYYQWELDYMQSGHDTTSPHYNLSLARNYHEMSRVCHFGLNEHAAALQWERKAWSCFLQARRCRPRDAGIMWHDDDEDGWHMKESRHHMGRILFSMGYVEQAVRLSVHPPAEGGTILIMSS